MEPSIALILYLFKFYIKIQKVFYQITCKRRGIINRGVLLPTRRGPNETRTHDLLLTRQALCHLSHGTVNCFDFVFIQILYKNKESFLPNNMQKTRNNLLLTRQALCHLSHGTVNCIDGFIYSNLISNKESWTNFLV